MCVVRHPSWEESEELDGGPKPLHHFGVVFTTVLFVCFLNPPFTLSYPLPHSPPLCLHIFILDWLKRQPLNSIPFCPTGVAQWLLTYEPKVTVPFSVRGLPA